MSSSLTQERISDIDLSTFKVKNATTNGAPTTGILLVELRFRHHSPKDSRAGVRELIIASSLDQAVEYIDLEHMGLALEEMRAREDRHTYHPVKGFWKANPAKHASTRDFGLEIGDYGEVEGTAYNLTRWLQSDSWMTVEDAYYGVTHWDWSRHFPVSLADAEVLLRLGLAKDIRQSVKK